MRTFLLMAAVLGVLNLAFVYVGGITWLTTNVPQLAPRAEHMRTDAVTLDVFAFTLEEEVRKKIGQPVNGFEPSMFLEVFPGLAETDFEGVEASIGYYTMEDGRLVHKLDETKLIHPAAKAVSHHGMEILLHNVATRIGVNLQTDGTITDVMRALTRE